MAETLARQTIGPDGVAVSRIALGCMGLAGTHNPDEVGPENRRRAIATFECALDAGITFYDHADIYSGTACESLFKDCLAAVPGSREKIFIATKAGIRKGYYDHSPEYLRQSIRGSLERMGLDYVDLYQLHRPDPLSDPRETAAVLDEMVESGQVRYIGVSNYYPHQVAALRRHLNAPLISNQIAISLLRLDPIYEGAVGAPGAFGVGDGVLDQCAELDITPLAFSPLGRGWLAGRREVPTDLPERAAIERILELCRELNAEYGGATPAQLALAWLLRHPGKIIPLVGSNNPAHIREAVGAASIELSRIDWYRLFVAARGERVP